MLRKHCEVGIRVSYLGNIKHYGTVVKLKPIVVVIEVYDAVSGDLELHEISYSRVEKEK